MNESIYKIYDTIVANTIYYFVQNKADIKIKKFDNKNFIHKYYFEIASMASGLYNKQIYINMPLCKYIPFKIKNRKKVKLKWISNEKVKFESNIEDILKTMMSDISICADIYNTYYKEEKK